MKAVGLVCGLLLCGSGATALACEHPRLPVIPDEETIENRVEQAVKDDMRRYLARMNAYVVCVRTERAAARDDASGVRRSLLAARNNLATAEVQAVREVYETRVGPIADLVFDAPIEQPDSRSARRPRRFGSGHERALRRRDRLRNEYELCDPNMVCPADSTFPDAGR